MKRQTYTQHVSYELSDGKATASLGWIVMPKYRKDEENKQKYMIICRGVLLLSI